MEKIQKADPQAYQRLVGGDQTDNRFCKICLIQKMGRIHHCKRCKQCVPSFDHFCPWLNSCIGTHNYRLFYLQAVYGCMVGFLMSSSLTFHLVKSIVQSNRANKGNGSEPKESGSIQLESSIQLNDSTNLEEDELLNLPEGDNAELEGGGNLKTKKIDETSVEQNGQLKSKAAQGGSWMDRASWTTLLLLLFVIALSTAVSISLAELSIRYFRYIVHNITLMDKDKIPNSTLYNLRRIFGTNPVLWILPISNKYFPSVRKYSGFYVDGKEVIYNC